MTDSELIQRYLAGEVTAFNTLVWRWEKPIFNFCYRYLGNDELARDVTQQVFIRTYKNMKKLRTPDKFSSWIYQIASNLCKDEIKRMKRRNNIPLDYIRDNHQEHEFDLMSDEHSQPDSVMNRKQIESIVRDALLEIPEEQRVVIIMKEYQGLKFQEIADALGESINTVKSRMYYGLNALGKVFDRWEINKEVLHYEV
ncbi:sigma-70 family RNA polymerase sigma factor [candidate division KSB1 bacterium]|nr:sigma-70 family RNA polymerase sigma factor [candidate division KSB1 bacterium]